MIELSPQQSDAVRAIRDWFMNDSAHQRVFRLGGFAGSGKAQPLDAMIETPYGPRPMGELKVGDPVIGQDGRACVVVAISEQGVQPCYEIEFRDRTKTRCHPNHLWTIFDGASAFARNTPKTIETKEMVNEGVIYPCGVMRYRTPLNEPVHYATDIPARPIDPWLLGLILADGTSCNTAVGITVSKDQLCLIDQIEQALPEGVLISRINEGKGCVQVGTRGADTHGNPLMKALRELGVAVKGPDKFIPERYLLASVEERWQLLRGLMDGDGSCMSNRAAFHSHSNQLVEGVARLVRSLGGTAVIRSSERSRNGRTVTEYNVNVKTFECPFTLPDKAAEWKPTQKNPPSKYIKSIRAIAPCEQRCIMVDNEDGLYLTDDFIVTHNSTLLPFIIEALKLNPERMAFAAPTGKAAKVMGDKMRAQGINQRPKTIHSLIYQPKLQKADVLEREYDLVEDEIDRLKKGMMAPPSGNLEADLDELKRKLKIIAKDLKRAYQTNDLRFSLNPESELVTGNIQLIVLDEGSMVGEEIANDLFSFEIPILVMGDPGQLQPVGDDPGYFVPDDLPDFFLTEVHRQAQDNPIIRLATMVRKGQRPDYGDYGDGVLVIPRKKDDFTLDPESEAQIIVGKNATRWKITSKIRKAAGFDTVLPCKGEPLLICKNHKEYPELINGLPVFSYIDHGDAREGNNRFICEFWEEEQDKTYRCYTYQGLFEEHVGRERNFATAPDRQAHWSRKNDTHIDFAWAITCHKAQGSQWDDVIVHDESNVFRNESDKWLYTAITRAAQRLVIVG